MGISGLLPVLKSIREQKHVKEFARTRVGVDAYGWLHKGTFSCALQLCKGIETNAYVDYCMYRVRMLIHFGATPVLVFDGAALPMKADTHAERRSRRQEAIKKAEEAEAAGKPRVAMEFYQRACGVTPDMARKLIRECRKINVEYIVAPYEADAQLAWMMQTGYVDSVITEDSDLLVYGAKKVFYKMTKDGNGDLYEMKNLPSLDELSMINFTEDMFVYMCVCSGCDFFKGVQGLGLKKAHNLVKRFRTLPRIVQAIRHDRRYTVAKSFATDFSRACLVFRHQTVFDVRTSQHVHLQELDDVAKAKIPPGVLTEAEGESVDLSFLGVHRDSTVAKRIAEGLLHPSSLKEYDEPLDIVERPITRKKKRPYTPELSRSQSKTFDRAVPKRKGFQVQPAASNAGESFPVTPNLKQRLSGRPRIFNPRLASANKFSSRISADLRKPKPAFSSSVWDKFRKQDKVEKESKPESGSPTSKQSSDSNEERPESESDKSSSENEQEPIPSTLDNRAVSIGNTSAPTKRRKLGSGTRKSVAVDKAISRFAIPSTNEAESSLSPTEEVECPPSPDREAYELFEKVDADLSGNVNEDEAPPEPREESPAQNAKVVCKEVRVSRFFNKPSGVPISSSGSRNDFEKRKLRKSSGRQGELQFRGASRRSNSLKEIDNFKRGATGKRITAQRPKR